MSKYLNELEFAILQEVLKDNLQKEYIVYLLKHLPLIEVKNREVTGVGMYINLKYSSDGNINFDEDLSLSLSSSKNIKFDNFDEYFSFELDVSKGRMNYIELVTYKSGWNGTYNTFNFEG